MPDEEQLTTKQQLGYVGLGFLIAIAYIVLFVVFIDWNEENQFFPIDYPLDFFILPEVDTTVIILTGVIGSKLSLETRNKISKKLKGNKNPLGCIRSKETKELLSKLKKGKSNHRQGTHHKPETILKIKAQKGWKHSDETKLKLRFKNLGEKNPMYGKHHNKETRKLISLGLRGRETWIKGKHHSDATKLKISLSNKGNVTWNKGKVMPEGFGEKIKKIVTGRKHSEDTIKKLSLSKLGKNNPMFEKFGKSHPMYGYHHTKEAKEKMRLTRSRQTLPRQDTKPERIIQGILNHHGISFETHKAIKMSNGSYCRPDIIIDDVCLQVDGCYYHACPTCYPDRTKLNVTQLSNIHRDIHTNNELTKLKYHVIRIWEHDIIKKTEEVKKRILCLESLTTSTVMTSSVSTGGEIGR